MAAGLASPLPPLVYLHFHKAAGTTACTRMAAGPLNVATNSNCNCNDEGFKYALRAGDGAGVARAMRAHAHDVCFVEDARWWPLPTVLANLNGHVRMATTLRDPWERLISNYERDTTICRGCAANSSLERYMEMQGCYPSIRFSVQLPDFYVRTLTGKATQERSYVASLNSSDLEAAQQALQLFDHVLVLEHANFAERMAALAQLPYNASADQHESNNAFSKYKVESAADTEALRSVPPVPPCILSARGNAAELRAKWLSQQSRLDAALYDWAIQNAVRWGSGTG